MKYMTTYNINELSQDVKETVIERERNSDNGLWRIYAGDALDEWKERLDLIGFTDADIDYSGFYSQGDGASFTAIIDLDKVLNTLIMCGYVDTDDFNFKRVFIFADNDFIHFGITRLSSRYAHEKTCDVYSNLYINSTHDIHDKLCIDIAERIDSLRIDLCQAIYKDLEAQYEYLQTDEFILDNLTANNLQFTISGVLV
jgi:hypothetical protein